MAYFDLPPDLTLLEPGQLGVTVPDHDRSCYQNDLLLVVHCFAVCYTDLHVYTLTPERPVAFRAILRAKINATHCFFAHPALLFVNLQDFLATHMSSHNNTDGNGFTERLRALIETQSTRGFAQKAGMGDSTLRAILSGAMPRLDNLLRISEAADVSVEWLATGKKPTKSDFHFGEEFSLIPVYNAQVATGHETIADDETPSRELAFRKKWLRFRGFQENDLVLVFAKGDSMEPTISNNEAILVDTSKRQLRDGHIYAIRNGDHLLVKRIQALWNDGVQLLSDNKEYPPQEISSPSLEDLEVIGKVVWVGKDL